MPSSSSRATPARSAWPCPEAFAFFDELMESRRREPREDLATVLAQATLRGEPVPRFELFSLLFLVMVAGHDTTRNAISSGLLALLEHPEEFEKLRKDPSLIDTAADEIIRSTSPVIHFVRTATEDYELRGQKIREGDSVPLFYPSANRDEDIFEDPFASGSTAPRIRTWASASANTSAWAPTWPGSISRVFFRQLVERFESIELAGPVELLARLRRRPQAFPIRFRVCSWSWVRLSGEHLSGTRISSIQSSPAACSGAGRACDR